MAILKIYDNIVAGAGSCSFFGDSAGVTFNSVDDFVSSIPAEDPGIEMQIHCNGGSVSEGWAIVDKLRSTGKRIIATIDGTCASMAVSILLAASERRAQPHATIHIHKPYYPPRSLSGAYNEDDLERIASDLKNETQKMIDWYVERTGANREELEVLMAEDKDISAEEALRLGFVTSIVPPMSASTSNQLKPVNMAKTLTKASVINALASFLGVKVNVEGGDPSQTIETADGRSFTLLKAEGEPAVGDAAEPDGEYPLNDGRIVVVADGAITEIRDAVPEETVEPAEPEATAQEPTEPAEPAEPSVDPAKAENEALKAENEELKKEIEELKRKLSSTEKELPTEEIKAIVEKVNACGGSEWLKRVAKSNYTPKERQTASKAVAASRTNARLEELRERAKNRK